MGRPYEEEIATLLAGTNGINESAIEALTQAFALVRDHGLVVVASGGARVVAGWACDLYRQACGRAAVAMTPLEFASIELPVTSTVWLLSASGRHADILEASRRAFLRGDVYVQAIIGRKGSELEALLQDRGAASSIVLDVGGAPDGFLATRSVWLMSCALARACATFWRFDHSVSSARAGELLRWGAETARACDLGAIDVTAVVLHDAWTALGASDLETRLIEASLADVWRADYRNFAHGRHFWLADRSTTTHVFALHTQASAAMAHATLSLLPSSVAVTSVEVPFERIEGALASMALSIFMTARFGERKSRDPGRPGVPEFGEHIYSGGFPYPETRVLSAPELAAQRKIGACRDVAAWRTAWRTAANRFVTTGLRGIVFDYDGTLVETARRYESINAGIATALNRLLKSGFRVGVATGRGDSAQRYLKEAIAPEYWDQVIVGYHNGSLVQPLALDTSALDDVCQDPDLGWAAAALSVRFARCGSAQLRFRPTQITASPASGLTLDSVWRTTCEVLAQAGIRLDVWLSSHSVDVVALGVGKLRVVDRLAAHAGCSVDAIARMGDRGAWPGNDWQMLAHPLGLSVDECSADPVTCWNFLPSSVRGAAGTRWLLERLVVHDGIGAFDFSEALK